MTSSTTQVRSLDLSGQEFVGGAAAMNSARGEWAAWTPRRPSSIPRRERSEEISTSRGRTEATSAGLSDEGCSDDRIPGAADALQPDASVRPTERAEPVVTCLSFSPVVVLARTGASEAVLAVFEGDSIDEACQDDAAAVWGGALPAVSPLYLADLEATVLRQHRELLALRSAAPSTGAPAAPKPPSHGFTARRFFVDLCVAAAAVWAMAAASGVPFACFLSGRHLC